MTRATRHAVRLMAVMFVVMGSAAFVMYAQNDVTDRQLEAASGERVVRLGPAAGNRGRVLDVPLEVYVARVLAGEGEPDASDAARQALAIAIRTYAMANAGRHARDGFDLCDGTHCQVPRGANAATRRTALATAGQILEYEGAPAELFYSASCGGSSESAQAVWPGAEYPYLRAIPDDVHENDAPWIVELTFDQLERGLERAGFEGRLRDVRIEERNASGRVARLHLPGLVPDTVAGDEFRAAIGTTTLRSTAFSVESAARGVRFTGRGFGHGVGMCVIGAGRRASRGEDARTILAHYYPGLRLARLTGTAEPAATSRPNTAPAARSARPVRRAIVVDAPSAEPAAVSALEQLTARTHAELSAALGVSVVPVTVRLHPSLESFRAATGRPWWVSSVAEGTSVDLAPAALLAQRDGLEATVRAGIAELLMSETLRERPRWVRVGASRFFSRERRDVAEAEAVRCPAEAELTLAVSAAAQRDAEARAEACFAREYARTADWRLVR